MPKFEEMIFKNNTDLEQQVLCHIMITRKMVPDLLPEYFTGIRYNLFLALCDQWIKSSIDPVILKPAHGEAIKNCLSSESTGSQQAIDELHKLWKCRAVAALCVNIQGVQSTDEMLSKLQFEAGQIALRKTGIKYNHQEECLKLIKALEAAHNARNKTAGYPTGLREFDTYLSGIERGKMYAIGALKKTGKSRFAIYLSIKLKEAGASVLWNSLEMNAFQLNSCALAYYMECDSKNFGREMPKRDYEKMNEKINDLYELKWIISSEKNVRDLRARIIFEQSKKPIDIVIVDFIQRMEEPELRKDRAREVEYISKGLADISRELNVGMIVLSQLSGLAEKLGDEEMPNMSHFKESQGIPENADAIITLHNFKRRENPFNADGSYRLQEINCLIEQRYGFSGCLLKFMGDMRTCHFSQENNGY